MLLLCSTEKGQGREERVGLSPLDHKFPDPPLVWPVQLVECVAQAYFTVTSASTFAGAFTLTAMSADRCAAVCCPVASRAAGCRTPAVARLVILAVWASAVVAVFPVTVYAQLVPSSRGDRSALRRVGPCCGASTT